MATPEQEHLMGSNQSVGSFVGTFLKPVSDVSEILRKKKLQILSCSTNLTKDQIDFIKACPKNLVEKFNIQVPNDAYLSESSVDDDDFEVLKNDNFFQTLSKEQEMPAYDSNTNYETEFFKLHIKNQSLLQELDEESTDKVDIEMKLLKI